MKKEYWFSARRQGFANRISKIVKKYDILNDLLIGFLVISVAFACLFPFRSDVEVAGVEEKVFRSGNSQDGVSLTFNVYSDTKSLERILTALGEYDACATFFVGGCWADDNVDALRKIVDNGHELGNHGYFHQDHPSLSNDDNSREISTCNDFVKKAINYEMKFFAPPSGAYDQTTVEIAESLGMKTILWSRDTIDWRDKNTSTVYTRATRRIKAGEIVLMHPTPHTADAMPDILKYYAACGLRAITVGENLRQGG